MNRFLKNAVLLCLAMLTSMHIGYGQYGINLFYKKSKSVEAWNQVLSEPSRNDILPNMYGFSLDYWFRIKKYRIEFLPELSYSTGDKGGLLFDDGQSGQLKWQELGFTLNTNIYLFDLLGDCNCPTFDKQNTLFKKGFYVQISPGVTFAQGNINASNNNVNKTNILPSLSFGAGLDIGVSKLITITPWIRYFESFLADWLSLEVYQDLPGANHELYKTNINGFLFGIRLGYRLDYKKRY